MPDPDAMPHTMHRQTPLLESLLSEPIAAAHARTATWLERHLPDTAPLVLFGAGRTGQAVLHGLEAIGRPPLAFIDDTAGKRGTRIGSLPVLGRDEVAGQLPAQAVILACIANNAAPFLDLARTFRHDTGRQLLSFHALSWRYPQAFADNSAILPPDQLLGNADALRALHAQLADDRSREELVRNIAFRLSLDFDWLLPPVTPAYFPADIDLSLAQPPVFIDAGAYDGDTVQALLSYAGTAGVGCICAFEPDPTNFRRLRATVDRLGLGACSKLHQAAIGAEAGLLRFRSTGDASAALDGSGDLEVEVRALREVLRDTPPGSYVKFDIEGAETAAIFGALGAIAAARPTLAISVYHRAEDLWRIPLALHALNVGYRFFLRSHGQDGNDLVCYAVPDAVRSDTGVEA